jgi:uncharacterized protein (DUF433 family)
MVDAPVKKVTYSLLDGRKLWQDIYNPYQQTPKPPYFPPGIELRAEIEDLGAPGEKRELALPSQDRHSVATAILDSSGETQGDQHSLAAADPPADRIIKTPGVCGGDARIQGTRISVWGLEEWRRLGWSDARILDAFPQLQPDDLAAAWAYVAQHSEEIEQAIRENQEA